MNTIADALPIVSVAVSGAVALVVPIVAALWARANLREQLRHQRGMDDLRELRTLLDEAAQHLTDAEIADRNLYAELRTAEDRSGGATRGVRIRRRGGVGFTPRMEQLNHERWDALHRALASQGRIAMRLGHGTDLAESYYSACMAFSEAFVITQNDPQNEQRRKKLAAEFVDGREAFVTAARALAASRLPE